VEENYYGEFTTDQFFVSNHAEDQVEYALSYDLTEDYNPIVEPLPHNFAESKIEPMVLSKTYMKKVDSERIYQEYPTRRYDYF